MNRWHLLFIVLGMLSCGVDTETPVVTAQISRSLIPEFCGATVLLGKARVSLPDVAPNPDPWDTSFSPADFPVWLTPLSGATIVVNSETIASRVSGIYFSELRQLGFMQRCDLRIRLNDPQHPDEITGSALLPDSFSILRPLANAFYGYDTLRVVWSRSDSAQRYFLEVVSEDTLNRARGCLLMVNDTTALVPKTAFEDSVNGNFAGGYYSVSVWAVNGGWKRTSDVLLNGGNIQNAVGLFGAAVYPPAVRIRVDTATCAKR